MCVIVSDYLLSIREILNLVFRISDIDRNVYLISNLIYWQTTKDINEINSDLNIHYFTCLSKLPIVFANVLGILQWACGRGRPDNYRALMLAFTAPTLKLK